MAVDCIEHFNLQSHVAGHFYLKTQVVRLISDTSRSSMPIIRTLLLIIWASREQLRESENGSHGKGLTKMLLTGIKRSICA